MIISVWRYSHLALALSSFLLLTVASVTGIFLAFEPIIEKSENYKTAGFDTLTLAQSIPVLKDKFPGIQEVIVNDYQFVLVKYADEKTGDKQVYVNAATGEILGTLKNKSPLFQWMTTLHRSLFMHETGRILVGISAFLLILIAISGILLVVQRQNGWKHFFSTVEKTGFAQYYHVVFGRIALFFILAIALTGTYLAVYRLVPPPAKASAKIDENNFKEEPLIASSAFPVFKQTLLSDLQKLQYPFSDFPEDYYTIELTNEEICVNQFTGAILAKQAYTRSYQLANFSLRWHTGRSGTVWALIMAVASGYILFFIYSGFLITLKRKRSRSGNKFKVKDARVVLLVGSENGSTFKFADAVYNQLLKQGEKVFVTDMSNFTTFPNASHLVVMTSTYGRGDAPSNAKKIINRIQQYAQQQTILYSVVGFGSRSYTDFCKFAFDVDAMLQATNWAKAITPVYTVNDKSPQDFSSWLDNWTQKAGFAISMPPKLLQPDTNDLKKITVINRTQPDAASVFIIRFKASKLKQAVSGDLLAIYPENDYRERYYSIGKIDNVIQLSVKLHEKGLGSGFLNRLQKGDGLLCKLVKNQHFRFPVEAKKIIMVCNGTGIAPFLGMIHENRKKIPIELYCGFRTRSAFELYQSFLHHQTTEGRLTNFYLSLSREEEEEKEYVSHRILKNEIEVLQTLKQSGVMMICGSLSMHDDVMKALENILENEAHFNIDTFIDNGQILTDCY